MHCTQSMWQKFVQSTPLLDINSLALLSVKGEQTVLQVTQLWQHEYQFFSFPTNLHLSCANLSKLERKCSILHQYGPVSTAVSKHPHPQETGYTPRGNLWFYLHDHRKDKRKWDGKPTTASAAWVQESRGSTTTTGNSSSINAAPDSSGHVLRQTRRADVTSEV